MPLPFIFLISTLLCLVWIWQKKVQHTPIPPTASMVLLFTDPEKRAVARLTRAMRYMHVPILPFTCFRKALLFYTSPEEYRRALYLCNVVVFKMSIFRRVLENGFWEQSVQAAFDMLHMPFHSELEFQTHLEYILSIERQIFIRDGVYPRLFTQLEAKFLLDVYGKNAGKLFLNHHEIDFGSVFWGNANKCPQMLIYKNTGLYFAKELRKVIHSFLHDIKGKNIPSSVFEASPGIPKIYEDPFLAWEKGTKADTQIFHWVFENGMEDPELMQSLSCMLRSRLSQVRHMAGKLCVVLFVLGEVTNDIHVAAIKLRYLHEEMTEMLSLVRGFIRAQRIWKFRNTSALFPSS